eukprot:g3902.t1
MDVLDLLTKGGASESAALLGQGMLAMDVGMKMKMEAAPDNALYRAKVLKHMGDALFAGRLWRRALLKYTEAISAIENEMEREKQSANIDAQLLSKLEALRIVLLESCSNAHAESGDFRNALARAQEIPTEKRGFSISLQCGKIYRSMGSKQNALQSYRAALEAQPLAIEAAIAMVDCGADASLAISICGDALANYMPSFAALLQSRELEVAHRSSEALEELKKVDGPEKDCLMVVLAKARLTAQMGNDDEAIPLFEQAHILDDSSLEDMEIFAEVLFRKREDARLNRLTHWMLRVDKEKPQPWIAAALYAMLRGDSEKAIGYANQAISVGASNDRSHCAKGHALLMSKDASSIDAVSSFKKAHAIRPSKASFKGLVDAYLLEDSNSLAAAVAREAMQVMPSSALSFVLLGTVCIRSPHLQGKAKAAFKRALTIDPDDTDAIFASVELGIASGADEDALALLKGAIARNHDHRLYCKLADVYTNRGDLLEAIENYQMSLSIDPSFDLAQMGLDRAEKLVQGGGEDEEVDDEEEEY